MSQCVISGIVKSAAGVAVQNALIRSRIVGTPLVEAAAHVRYLPTPSWTDAGGAWSVTYPQGAIVRIEIPDAGVDHYGVVPATSTADFATLQPSWSEWIE